MENLFRAFKVATTGTEILAYLIESTAPDNIDDKLKAQEPPEKTVEDDADKAIETISSQLHKSSNPTLVISVHGFNNPRKIVLPGYQKAFTRTNNEKYINNNDVVCIGYRWPSE